MIKWDKILTVEKVGLLNKKFNSYKKYQPTSL